MLGGYEKEVFNVNLKTDFKAPRKHVSLNGSTKDGIKRMMKRKEYMFFVVAVLFSATIILLTKSVAATVKHHLEQLIWLTSTLAAALFLTRAVQKT